MLLPSPVPPPVVKSTCRPEDQDETSASPRRRNSSWPTGPPPESVCPADRPTGALLTRGAARASTHRRLRRLRHMGVMSPPGSGARRSASRRDLLVAAALACWSGWSRPVRNPPPGRRPAAARGSGPKTPSSSTVRWNGRRPCPACTRCWSPARRRASRGVFRGPGLDRAVNVKSCSKSVVSALAAQRRSTGHPRRGRPARRADPRGPRAADADPRVGAITIDHLLTMRAGLGALEPELPVVGCPARTGCATCCRGGSSTSPASAYSSTGGYHLLSTVLTQAAGRSGNNSSWRAPGWAPLGIDIPSWTRDPQGFISAATTCCSPRGALLRFGEAYRLGGIRRRQAGAAGQLDRGVMDAARAFALHRPPLRLRLVHCPGARPSRLLRVSYGERMIYMRAASRSRWS